MENDRYILRSITDEIMYEIMRLSGQEYVDMYATKAKDESQAAREGGQGGRGRPGRRGRRARTWPTRRRRPERRAASWRLFQRPDLAVEDRLFRALAVLRVVVLVNVLALNIYRADNFDHPVAGRGRASR